MLFSQRKGLKPIKTIIQIDSVDSDLRVGLWNALDIFYWGRITKKYWISDSRDEDISLLRKIWIDYFKKPLDTLDGRSQYVYNELRNYYFNSKWYEIYDFIEFITESYSDKEINEAFMAYINSILKKELSGYRFVGGKITQITSGEEISAIEEALNIPDKFKGVKIHLESALDKLSDRKSPDYRNSIKESISAVESMIEILVNEKCNFKNGLKKIEEKYIKSLHPALKEAFIKLYGYTSDAEGIRHALLGEPELKFEDAKFMLVSCSAFVNYLIAKFQTK